MQPACYQTAAVSFPALNGAWVFNAQLSSLNAAGPVTYSVAANPYLSFSSPTTYNTATVTGMNVFAGQAGQVMDLIIQQAETANYYGDQVMIPGAVRVYAAQPFPNCPL